MLIKCPECELQISDKAFACPHCGYPLKQSTPSHTHQSNRRRRLPNGFGQISLIKNKNLRSPYRAMIPNGKTETGRPLSRILGYYKTYNDAYTALSEYQKNPYDLDTAITLQELYDKWSEFYFEKYTSGGNKRTIEAAWAKCSKISSMKVRDVRARHVKNCIEECSVESIKPRIKSMFNIMLDYAVEYELADKNYARTFNLDKISEVENEHIAFTKDELETLWNNSDDYYVRIILIQTYTGLRPKELCEIRKENVNISRHYLIGGMKTKAGTNRLIPIHSKISNFVEGLMATDGDKLIPDVTYDIYRNKFKNIIAKYKLSQEHRPHDPRKTFITLAKAANVDEYAIKRIVGHNINDITEKVYTERDNDWLLSEIEKIK